MREPLPRVVLWSVDRVEPLIDQMGSDLALSKQALPNPGSIVTRVNGSNVRLCRKEASNFCAMAISSDPDRIKSKAIMEKELSIVLAAAPGIDAASQRAEQRARRLIHNLKSLTAKTNQEVFSVLPQDRMIDLNRDALPHIEEEVAENLPEAAKAFLGILKHQAAQKAEFFAFEKMAGSPSALRIEPHGVHSVLMNAFYLFFGDFESKKVRAHVAKTQQVASFDYDSIHACIYYLVENAVKYTRRNSSLNVTVSVDPVRSWVDIRFDMESLTISTAEVDAVFDEGYSGGRAIARNLHGAGIGLFQAREMARLNGGDLYLLAGKQIGNDYSRNTFTITLPV
jgi:signal transduction histidine kinase